MPRQRVVFAPGKHCRFGVSCLQGTPQKATFALYWLPYTDPFLFGEKPRHHCIWCSDPRQDTAYSVQTLFLYLKCLRIDVTACDGRDAYRDGPPNTAGWFNDSVVFPLSDRCDNRLCRSRRSAQTRGWIPARVRTKRFFSWRSHQNTPTVCMGTVQRSSIYVAFQLAVCESDARMLVCISPKRVNLAQ